MTETPSTAAKTLKIVLWIFLGTAGLCALCCGGVLLFSKDTREGIAVAWRFVGFNQAVHAKYGAGTQISMTARSDETGSMAVLAVGIPGFDAAKAAEEQDAIWKMFAEAFREGAPPVTHLAVGFPATGSSTVDWKPEHKVPVEELVGRTGVPAPPTVLIDQKPAPPAKPPDGEPK
jgi:hypothetical protein